MPGRRRGGASISAVSLTTVLVFSGLAGIAIPIGACIAYAEESLGGPHHNLRGAIIAFGGGILLGAMAFELVLTGLEAVHVGWAAFAFVGGTAVIMFVDRALESYAGPLAQGLAMTTDFLPEAIAFGALFGGESIEGQVFAVLIALQNLPEAYASFHQLRDTTGMSPGGALARLAPLALIGPVAAVAGFLFLTQSETVVGSIALFAGGGILYLVFHGIAPEAFEEGSWVATGTVTLGFVVAVVFHGVFS